MAGGPETAPGTLLSRANGWSCPPPPMQIVAWTAFILFALFTIFLLGPSFAPLWQPLPYACVGIFLVAHIVTHLIVVSLNPGPAAVRHKMHRGTREVVPLDRTVHRRPIEDLHCFICEVDVDEKTKHCRECNKCIENFDHHCYWLNNCIGGRNYKVFLATLLSALLGCFVIFIISLIQFIAYFTDKNHGEILKAYYDLRNSADGPVEKARFTFFYGPIPGEVWETLTAVVCLLALITQGLVGHLFGFHLYIIWRGMSTYEFILWQRDKRNRKPEFRDMDDSSQSTQITV